MIGNCLGEIISEPLLAGFSFFYFLFTFLSFRLLICLHVGEISEFSIIYKHVYYNKNISRFSCYHLDTSFCDYRRRYFLLYTKSTVFTMLCGSAPTGARYDLYVKQ
jgi:hypothetical protein